MAGPRVVAMDAAELHLFEGASGAT
jgi:hypothetical protein